MKEIQLTHGKVAFVDNEDYEKVAAYRWCASLHRNHWYAVRAIRFPDGKRSTVSMHRFITGIEYGDPRQVDHIDRENTLDNRRSNLRVTLTQNQQNRGLQKNNTSGFKGVHWHKRNQKWSSELSVNGKSFYIGQFPTPELAAAAYDAAVLEHHGGFAVTNAMLQAA